MYGSFAAVPLTSSYEVPAGGGVFKVVCILLLLSLFTGCNVGALFTGSDVFTTGLIIRSLTLKYKYYLLLNDNIYIRANL